ncbi:hypothetical protein [Sediminibacter sp. Hel_I_10]|uniref:hypothetical protein n=1 Tax=Sediminibacter sp. Hel_I_10 TaxID=1392490 RepID=UPI00047CB477|nr:hypothetical protein [Sediminibacter sp. Hel_I_10]
MRTSIKYQVGLETLQKILLTSLKAEASYEHLMSQTKNEIIFKWLENRKECTTDFILKVLTQLENMEATAPQISNIQYKLFKLLSDIKSLIFPKGDADIIREGINVDGQYLKGLNEVLKDPTITDTLYSLYSKQIELLRASVKQVETDQIILQ